VLRSDSQIDEAVGGQPVPAALARERASANGFRLEEPFAHCLSNQRDEQLTIDGDVSCGVSCFSRRIHDGGLGPEGDVPWIRARISRTSKRR